MTEDKTTPKTGIKSLIKGLNTFYLIREYKQTLQASTLINNQWKTIGLQDIPLSNALSRIVLLIPNDETIFRQQQFSTDLVTEKDLKEAISLNIENWSPYPPNSPQFSITKKTKGQWVVATWLWKQSTQDRLINALPASIRHTHVLPEITWDCARVTGNEPTLLVSQTAQHLVYTFLMRTIFLNT